MYGFNSCLLVACCGNGQEISGGLALLFFLFEKCSLALLWSDQLAISIISYSLNHILCSCEDVECGDQWFFSGINGYLEEKNKKKTW